jgi:serralysin
MSTTTNPLDALVAARDGYLQARWNFPLADGTPVASPGGIGEAVTLSYSFPDTDSSSYFSGPTTQFTTEMMDATRDVLARISEVANITFIEVSGAGQIAFRQVPQNSPSGDAFLPWFQWQESGGTIDYLYEPEVSGDVWMDDAQSWTAADLEPGGFAYLALLQKVGTALGLKDHSEQWSTMLAPQLDDQAHTVMSPIAAGSDRPSTLMPLDMQALQYLYGANTATRAGDDTYTWDASVPVLETIWDGGGNDTIDCSNQVLRCVIRLQPGAYSTIGTQGDIAIAKGVVIENAVGGRGSDTLIGNGSANRLAGRAGDDILAGAAGSDALSGGAGADVFDFNTSRHSGATAQARDVILDFTRGLDRIDLSGIDANDATAGNDGFSYIGADAFSSSDATGELRLEDGVIYGSTDADAAAEFSIEVVGATALGRADFVL